VCEGTSVPVVAHTGLSVNVPLITFQIDLWRRKERDRWFIFTKIVFWFGTTVLSIQLTNCTIQCNALH
jgi:hypothetical protein